MNNLRISHTCIFSSLHLSWTCTASARLCSCVGCSCVGCRAACCLSSVRWETNYQISYTLYLQTSPSDLCVFTWGIFTLYYIYCYAPYNKGLFIINLRSFMCVLILYNCFYINSRSPVEFGEASYIECAKNIHNYK